MSELDKAFDQWRALVDEMRAYIDAQRLRINELSEENNEAWTKVAELQAQLGKPVTADVLRPLRTSLRNMEVTLKGGKS